MQKMEDYLATTRELCRCSVVYWCEDQLQGLENNRCAGLSAAGGDAGTVALAMSASKRSTELFSSRLACAWKRYAALSSLLALSADFEGEDAVVDSSSPLSAD